MNWYVLLKASAYTAVRGRDEYWADATGDTLYPCSGNGHVSTILKMYAQKHGINEQSLLEDRRRLTGIPAYERRQTGLNEEISEKYGIPVQQVPLLIGDPRKFGVEVLNYKRISENNLDGNTATPADLRAWAKIVYKIWGQNAMHMTFVVEQHNPRKFWSGIPLSALQQGDAANLDLYAERYGGESEQKQRQQSQQWLAQFKGMPVRREGD